MSIEEAKAFIKAFETQEYTRVPNLDKEDLAIGQKFSLTLIKNFIAAIDRHPKADQIDAIRIYLAKSVRVAGGKELYDVVLVPVLRDDQDLHRVYDKHPIEARQETIIGEGLPCPNVCPDKSFYC